MSSKVVGSLIKGAVKKAKKRKPAAAAAAGGKRPPGNGKKFVTRKARDKEFSISKGLYDGRAMPQQDYDKLIANRERIAKNKKKKRVEIKAKDAILKGKSKRKNAGGQVKKTKYMSKGGPVPQRYAIASKRKK